jgi:hypothetical protein
MNSEGGIGVITKVTDGLADVKYFLTRWVEKHIPLRRLTTIIMPHRGAYAALRPKQPVSSTTTNNSERCFANAHDECDPTTEVWR